MSYLFMLAILGPTSAIAKIGKCYQDVSNLLKDEKQLVESPAEIKTIKHGELSFYSISGQCSISGCTYFATKLQKDKNCHEHLDTFEGGLLRLVENKNEFKLVYKSGQKMFYEYREGKIHVLNK